MIGVTVSALRRLSLSNDSPGCAWRIAVGVDLRHPFHNTARDYVEGMWMMLQQQAPDDFVLATGETHPVREFVNKAFDAAGIKLR